ncbi:PstS family phosphate ABC transporter substrate-binding protein [Flavobacterium sp. AED]|uniref:PstS family phosphate ABC transporter substrate-binding protein n=1 Tax=Flavobacterium sp. AED TaxID=1423323 RepID=UPI00057FFE4C|nr:substrate-binding domain-containing protein [Flavobacterium sp. AED]KIA87509.1 phosphate ABC transporter substrate-binding protein [Flavobacterium sp. AED]MDI1307015.1 extracellular solute-binding protein [bacterium]
MKTYKISFVAVIILLLTNATTTKVAAQDLKGNISISGAFALYPITVKWAEEFKKINPNVKIDIQAGGAGKGITDVLSKVTDIGLVSRDLNAAEYKKGAFSVAVTKDAVIPTISASSPYRKVLYEKGVKKDAFNHIFITGKYKTWNTLGFKSEAPIHVYTRSDASGAAETWAKYFNKKQEDLQGVAVFGDPGLAQAVKRDPSGLGFNNIVYVYDTKTNKPTNGVVPVPIDLNNNGKLDPDENFYDDIDQLIAAIVAGKYPSPPARDLYFVTVGKPKNPIVKEFIKYILTDGQKFVQEAGYIKFSKEKINKELEKVK